MPQICTIQIGNENKSSLPNWVNHRARYLTSFFLCGDIIFLPPWSIRRDSILGHFSRVIGRMWREIEIKSHIVSGIPRIVAPLHHHELYPPTAKFNLDQSLFFHPVLNRYYEMARKMWKLRKISTLTNKISQVKLKHFIDKKGKRFW